MSTQTFTTIGFDRPFIEIESKLSQLFRGHADRDWDEWGAHHAYQTAAEIPADAERAWIGRQGKSSYRGIGERKALRHLIAGNADQSFLDEIGEIDQLERLELEYPMVAADLSPLLRLKSLEFISIDTPRKIADFAPLLKLPRLRTLLIANAKHMPDIEWLEDAHHLEVIGIEGGIWATQRIPSLGPLRGLRSLRAFFGTSTRLTDECLMPLADCPNLEFVSIARVAPRAEFERLRAAKPKLVCSWCEADYWTMVGL